MKPFPFLVSIAIAFHTILAYAQPDNTVTIGKNVEFRYPSENGETIKISGTVKNTNGEFTVIEIGTDEPNRFKTHIWTLSTPCIISDTTPKWKKTRLAKGLKHNAICARAEKTTHDIFDDMDDSTFKKDIVEYRRKLAAGTFSKIAYPSENFGEWQTVDAYVAFYPDENKLLLRANKDNSDPTAKNDKSEFAELLLDKKCVVGQMHVERLKKTMAWERCGIVRKRLITLPSIKG